MEAVAGEAEGDDGAFGDGIGAFDAETCFRDVRRHTVGIAGGTVGGGPGELDAIAQGDAGSAAKAVHFWGRDRQEAGRALAEKKGLKGGEAPCLGDAGPLSEGLTTSWASSPGMLSR